MSGQPFMQLYPGDYLADTQDLTAEQHGAYLLILMAMWMRGGELPNDEKKLARIARIPTRRWKSVGQDVMALLTIENGVVTQKRLRDEYQKAVSKSDLRKQIGSLGGKAKALKNKEPPLAKGVAKSYHSPEPEPDRRGNTQNAGAREPTEHGEFLNGDWQPDGRDRQFAGMAGLSDAEIELEAEKFRDYYTGVVGDRSRSRNWAGRWKKWVRTSIDQRVQANGGRANAQTQSPAHRRAEPLRAATRKYLEELEAEEHRASAEPVAGALPAPRN